jgi:hypothetical protein
MRPAAERIERDRPEIARQRVDDAAAPPVERMIDAVARFGARRKGWPSVPAGHADKDDGADVRNLAIGETEGAARDEPGARDC